MKYLETAERRLLEILEAKDNGNGVDFVSRDDHLEKTWREDVVKAIAESEELNPETKYHLDLMYSAQLVRRRQGLGPIDAYSITSLGHARLAEIRSNTPFRRVIRYLGTLVDRILTSVFLPILVSVLTVIVMRMIGLDSRG